MPSGGSDVAESRDEVQLSDVNTDEGAGAGGAGRQSATETMPGSTTSRPVNQAASSAWPRSTTWVVEILFQRRAASDRAGSRSLAGWMTTRWLPGQAASIIVPRMARTSASRGTKLSRWFMMIATGWPKSRVVAASATILPGSRTSASTKAVAPPGPGRSMARAWDRTTGSLSTQTTRLDGAIPCAVS